MRGWTRLGRINAFGAPIYLHWSIFVVVGILALLLLHNPIYAVLFIASYFAIIFFHELGHAWAVRVSGNWRISFRFEGEDAVDVDYEDYH